MDVHFDSSMPEILDEPQDLPPETQLTTQSTTQSKSPSSEPRVSELALDPQASEGSQTDLTDSDTLNADSAEVCEFSDSSVTKFFAPASYDVPVQIDETLSLELAKIPNKLAFKIGEVADLVGVKPYVLRYWESEFEALRPKKSRSNQRAYERRDVEALMLIKKLLYRDRFSIEGAKAALKKLKKDNQRVKEIKTLFDHLEFSKSQLEDLISDLGDLKALLNSREFNK